MLSIEQHFCMEDKIIVGKVPREIIYDQMLGDKRILFFLQLYFSVTRSGDLTVITNECVSSMGFKPNTQKGRINDEFRNFVNLLMHLGYIKIIRKNKNYTKYQPLYLMEEQIPFAIIRYDEFQKIINNAPNKSAILLLLSFVRLNSYKRRSIKDSHPEIFFGYLSEIAEKLGMSIRSVSASLKNLSSLGIIYGEEQKRFQDKYGNWHSGVYIFIDKKRYKNDKEDKMYDWQSEFERASKWLMHEQLKQYK